jgi:nitrogen fixation protein NifX
MSLRIAFATSDSRHVDQHFGAARGFAIFEVGPDRATLIESTQFRAVPHDGPVGHDEDRLKDRIALLESCAAVYCQAVGASAVQQLTARGIQPVKVEEGSPIAQLLAALQRDMTGCPPLWLARALSRRNERDDSGRFDAMEAEGWDE